MLFSCELDILEQKRTQLLMLENESTYKNPLITEIFDSISVLTQWAEELLPNTQPDVIIIGAVKRVYPIVASEAQMDLLLKQKGLSTKGSPEEKAALLVKNLFTMTNQISHELRQESAVSDEAPNTIYEEPIHRADVLNAVERTVNFSETLRELIKESSLLEVFRAIAPDDFVCRSTDEDGRMQEYIQFFKTGIIANTIEDKSEYIFQLEGNIWKIVYQGKPTLLSHLDGFKYIQYLLQHVSESVAVQKLKDISGIVIDHGRYGRADGYKEAVNLIETKKAKKTITASKRFEIEEAMAELEAKLENIPPGSDEYYDYEEKIVKFKKLMSKAYDHHGKERKLVDSTENARTSVKKAINRAFAKIEKELPELAVFLRNTIRTGIACEYMPLPDNQPDWQF
jgi:hypothetical protein